jgi:hypothetical protein
MDLTPQRPPPTQLRRIRRRCVHCVTKGAGAIEAVRKKSCKIALPCHEIRKLAPELLSKPNEEGCVYVNLRGLACRSFERVIGWLWEPRNQRLSFPQTTGQVGWRSTEKSGDASGLGEECQRLRVVCGSENHHPVAGYKRSAGLRPPRDPASFAGGSWRLGTLSPGYGLPAEDSHA